MRRVILMMAVLVFVGCDDGSGLVGDASGGDGAMCEPITDRCAANATTGTRCVDADGKALHDCAGRACYRDCRSGSTGAGSCRLGDWIVCSCAGCS